jgi:hypothetical protein
MVPFSSPALACRGHRGKQTSTTPQTILHLIRPPVHHAAYKRFLHPVRLMRLCRATIPHLRNTFYHPLNNLNLMARLIISAAAEENFAAPGNTSDLVINASITSAAGVPVIGLTSANLALGSPRVVFPL